ncbi:MAG: GNAT family N-acetyltransferase [Proteobacteria bacterium]|nr:GNAT family N-acetyltransferase [Pseudomonadota bacterium]
MDNKSRKLTEEDLDKIYSIAQEVLKPLWSKKEYQYFLTQPNSFCWGMEDSEGLACFLLTLLIGTEVDVVAIATRKNAQGQKWARNLLKHILSLPGIQQAFLEVDPTNEPAVRLYLGTGFQVLGIRKKYYEGKKDAWLMKWSR